MQETIRAPDRRCRERRRRLAEWARSYGIPKNTLWLSWRKTCLLLGSSDWPMTETPAPRNRTDEWCPGTELNRRHVNFRKGSEGSADDATAENMPNRDHELTRKGTRSHPDPTPPGQRSHPPWDGPLEVALADAVQRAAVAGQWSTVEILSRELEARRVAREAREASERAATGNVVVELRPTKR